MKYHITWLVVLKNLHCSTILKNRDKKKCYNIVEINLINILTFGLICCNSQNKIIGSHEQLPFTFYRSKQTKSPFPRCSIEVQVFDFCSANSNLKLRKQISLDCVKWHLLQEDTCLQNLNDIHSRIFWTLIHFIHVNICLWLCISPFFFCSANSLSTLVECLLCTLYIGLLI